MLLYILHCMGFHILPVSVLDLFSEWSFFRNVEFMRASPDQRPLANGYAEQFVLSALFACLSIPMAVICCIRQLACMLGILSRAYMVARIVMLAVILFPIAGCVFLFAEIEGWSFSYATMWWYLGVMTGLWPMSIFASFSCLFYPAYASANIKRY